MTEPITLEAVRGWLNTGILAAILFTAVRVLPHVVNYLIESRKLKMQEKREDRQGYGELLDTMDKQLENLTTQVNNLSNENGMLRTEVRELHGVIDGMRRDQLSNNIALQKRIIALLPQDQITPEVQQALDVLSRIEASTVTPLPLRAPPDKRQHGRRNRPSEQD